VILALGTGLCILFVVWLWTAWALYIATAGDSRPEISWLHDLAFIPGAAGLSECGRRPQQRAARRRLCGVGCAARMGVLLWSRRDGS
jgi:hypothetical protein